MLLYELIACLNYPSLFRHAYKGLTFTYMHIIVPHVRIEHSAYCPKCFNRFPSANEHFPSPEPKQEEVKRLPGGKIKKKEKKEVVIEKVVRNKRKCITTVKGLELFGVKLSDASKKLGKKFATGASVVKGPTDKEQIDVQGNISYDIVEFITETWPDVLETAIFFIEDGKKVPAA
ncbi:hypothetical protein CRYUN_Cryun03dG0012900 [Craigia yunnanensis]